MKKVFMFDSFSGGVNLPITKRLTVTHDGKALGLLNMSVDKDGNFQSRKGWKTFKSMVKELNRLNKEYKKNKIVGDFTIRLPIKGNL